MVDHMTWRMLQALAFQGVEIEDLRDQLPVHPTKRWRSRDPADLIGVVIHHAAGNVDGIEGVEAVARYHIAPKPNGRDWPGIGYWGSIDSAGILRVHRDLDVHGAHANYDARPGSENADMIGLLLLGNFRGPHNDTADQHDPTLAQVEALGRTIRAMRSVFPGWVHEEHSGLWLHADLGKPACPGEIVERLIVAERQRTP